MSEYYEAEVRSQKVLIGRQIDKSVAMARIRRGEDVYAGTKRMAHTLAEAVSEGQGSWKDAAHVAGGYRHYHDVSHQYRGHIFFGGPHG